MPQENAGSWEGESVVYEHCTLDLHPRTGGRVDSCEFEVVWTDPRTDTEYSIRSDGVGQTDLAWPCTHYVVRNLSTGETTSFQQEDWEAFHQFLTKLVDHAEELVKQRSTNGRRYSSLVRVRRGAVNAVARGVGHLRRWG